MVKTTDDLLDMAQLAPSGDKTVHLSTNDIFDDQSSISTSVSEHVAIEMGNNISVPNINSSEVIPDWERSRPNDQEDKRTSRAGGRSSPTCVLAPEDMRARKLAEADLKSIKKTVWFVRLNFSIAIVALVLTVIHWIYSS